MNETQIESILSDFRDWLRSLPVESAVLPPQTFGLQSLVAPFTALRHEVNLQTKAARNAIEHSNTLLEELRTRTDSQHQSDDTDHLAPVVKLVLDLYDALSIAHGQMKKLPSVEREPIPPLPPRRGFWARMLGIVPANTEQETERARLLDERSRLHNRLAGAADGYAMSLRRVERSFPDLGLEPIDCLGEAFDPEYMEVVDTIAAGDEPAGTVVEIVRSGFIRNGTLLRYAQVKVAK